MTLFPPEAAPLLALHPHLHRLHRQVQLPLEVPLEGYSNAQRRRHLMTELG